MSSAAELLSSLKDYVNSIDRPVGVVDLSLAGIGVVNIKDVQGLTSDQIYQMVASGAIPTLTPWTTRGIASAVSAAASAGLPLVSSTSAAATLGASTIVTPAATTIGVPTSAAAASSTTQAPTMVSMVSNVVSVVSTTNQLLKNGLPEDWTNPASFMTCDSTTYNCWAGPLLFTLILLVCIGLVVMLVACCIKRCRRRQRTKEEDMESGRWTRGRRSTRDDDMDYRYRHRRDGDGESRDRDSHDDDYDYNNNNDDDDDSMSVISSASKASRTKKAPKHHKGHKVARD